ncbi:sensor histidine kinase [Mycolicibacterium phlei]|jgi:signal transduction histidine kinase
MTRRTIRFRLTAWYACAFFVAGAILVGLMYFSLAQALPNRPAAAQGIVQDFLAERGLRNRPVLDNLLSALAAQVERERQETLRTMLWGSLFALGAVGVAAVGFGWLLAGRALAPLQHVTATARRVAERNLHERIALRGPEDEIKELADTFDAMLERLDRAFDGQRRFVANASHELRTPLAISRTVIEVALDDPDVPEATRRLGETLLEVNLRNERLIDGLLTLATGEQGLGNVGRVDLGDVTRRAVESVRDAADHAGVRVEARIGSAPVRGDAALLQRLAENLLDNAIRYNVAEGGWVRVTVAGPPRSAVLTVENSGPVIPEHEVDGLFEPFRRLIAEERLTEAGSAPLRRGAGLGLSIVRSVGTAHGGSVQAQARPGGGLLVRVLLPVVQ